MLLEEEQKATDQSEDLLEEEQRATDQLEEGDSQEE